MTNRKHGERTPTPITASRFLTHLDAICDDLPYVLRSPLIYDSMRLRCRIIIPAGFSTDLASIPRLLWALLPKEGAYNRPAVVHDYLYASGYARGYGVVTRADADAVLLEAMHAVGVDADRAQVIYAGVRLGGWYPWGKRRRADVA